MTVSRVPENPASPRVALVIQYLGTNYHGWQRQKHERTIQGMIEAALKTMTAKKVTSRKKAKMPSAASGAPKMSPTIHE